MKKAVRIICIYNQGSRVMATWDEPPDKHSFCDEVLNCALHIHCISLLKELCHQVLNYAISIYVTRASHVYRCKRKDSMVLGLFQIV